MNEPSQRCDQLRPFGRLFVVQRFTHRRNVFQIVLDRGRMDRNHFPFVVGCGELYGLNAQNAPGEMAEKFAEYRRSFRTDGPKLVSAITGAIDQLILLPK